MPSSKVKTEVRNCVVSSDADCGVTKDLCTDFVSKITAGDVCTAVSNKPLARIPEFNFQCLLPKCSRKLRVNSKKRTASNDCYGSDEKIVGQNSASPIHHSDVDLSHVKEEPSVTSDMSSDASSVTPVTWEQVIPDFAFIMKTCCENPIVMQSIMMLLLNCHPELAFDIVTLELAAFREFMLLKLNKDKTDELAAEAVSLHWQRQNRLLAQKETASYSNSHEDSTCKTVQCHSRPVVSNTHFVPDQPSGRSITPELMNRKKALSQVQHSEWFGNQHSESCLPSDNLCQLPVTSSILNSVTDNVSTGCNSCITENCVDIQKGQNKNCGCQSGNLIARASLECGKKVCSLVQCSVHPDLRQKHWQTSVKVHESDNRKIDSLCNSFQSFLDLPGECGNFASVQTSAVTGISCMPMFHSQRNKPIATDCSSVVSKRPVVTQFLTGKISQNGDIKANATSTCSFNYLMNQQELSCTAASEVIKTDATPAYSSESILSLQSFSNLCLQEFPKTEPKVNKELNMQEVIHPSVTVVTKTESKLQSCMPNGQAVSQPPEVAAIDTVKIQTNLNSVKSIPNKNIVSNSDVRHACQNNIEQFGSSTFGNQKKTADRNNPEDIVICATTDLGDSSRIGNIPRLQFKKESLGASGCGDESRIGNVPRLLQCKMESLGDQRASATDSKPVSNLTNFDDTSFVSLNNVLVNAGQVKLLNENSKLHTYSLQRKGEDDVKQFSNVHNKMRNCNRKRSPMGSGGKWRKRNMRQNISQRLCYSPPCRRSEYVKPSAAYKEVGRLAEHSNTLTTKNGNWSVSGHLDFNGQSRSKKSDALRTDSEGLVKHEIAPNAKGLDHQQSRNAGIASGRPYILHFSYVVSSEHSMCNCRKEQDLDVFYGFSDFDLRPELREVISKLDFKVPTKVQRCCLRPLLDGLDVICAEGAGAGKTTLLALSTLQHLQSSNKQVAVLVLCHTYSAMVAVYECFRKFSTYMNTVRAYILNDKFESSQHLQLNGSQILIGSVQSVLQLTDVHPDLFLQLKHFILEDCDVMLRQTDICKNIEKIAELVPQEKQVILISKRMFPFIGNMFKKLVPYEVKMTTHSF